MPPTPIWKMRSLLFWLTCARAGHESEAMPVVTMAPDLRKLRRVTGEPVRELDWVFMFMVMWPSSCMARPAPQAKLGTSLPCPAVNRSPVHEVPCQSRVRHHLLVTLDFVRRHLLEEYPQCVIADHFAIARVGPVGDIGLGNHDPVSEFHLL